MPLTSVKPGDIVRCNVNGRVFLAVVAHKETGALAVEPITANINYRRVKSRQVIGHWRKAGRQEAA